MIVSVVIPCFNVEDYIQECLKSLETQNHQNMEVVCVNDGSSDNTLKELQAFQQTSKLNIVILNQKNLGAPAARNNGVRHSNGAYIQFLDADDLLKEDKISHQVKMAIKANQPDLIVGSFDKINMNNELLKTRIHKEDQDYNYWIHLLKSDLGNTCSNLFKADLFSNGISWNEKLKSSQEYDLMFQILKLNPKIVLDSHVNTTIRVRNSGSITQVNIDKKWERYAKLRIDIIDYLQKSRPQLLNDKIYQLLFGSIRNLYPYNPDKALNHFQNYIPKNFIPSVTQSTGRIYVLLFKLFGFKNTEKLRLLLNRKKAN